VRVRGGVTVGFASLEGRGSQVREDSTFWGTRVTISRLRSAYKKRRTTLSGCVKGVRQKKRPENKRSKAAGPDIVKVEVFLHLFGRGPVPWKTNVINDQIQPESQGGVELVSPASRKGGGGKKKKFRPDIPSDGEENCPKMIVRSMSRKSALNKGSEGKANGLHGIARREETQKS